MSERRRKSFVPPTPLTKLITAPSAPTTCYIPVPSLIHFQFVQILYSWITSSFFRAFLANWPNLRSCRPPENTLKMTNPFVQKFNLSMNRLGRKNFSSILLLIYLKAFSWLHFSDIKTLNPREKKAKFSWHHTYLGEASFHPRRVKWCCSQWVTNCCYYTQKTVRLKRPLCASHLPCCTSEMAQLSPHIYSAVTDAAFCTATLTNERQKLKSVCCLAYFFALLSPCFSPNTKLLSTESR